MWRKPLVFGLALALAIGTAAAGEASLSFNDENFDAWLTFGGRKADDGEMHFLFGGRYLYSDTDADDATIPAAVAGWTGRASANEDIRFFVGAQGLVGEAKGLDVEGVAVGGDASWTLERWKGVRIGARLYYAPGVFCFGDTESVFEWAGQIGYQINERIGTFLEYSKLTAEVEPSNDVEVRDGLTIGIGIRF